jgi:ABC-type multidrug transport system ATPase subunit
MPTSTMNTSSFLLQAHRLSGGPAGLSIIEHLNFNCPPGVSWICGDEGTGKTTLLRLLAGDMPPTSGWVTVPAGGVFWTDLQAPAHDHTTVQACWDALRASRPKWNETLQDELAQALDMHAHRHKRLNMLSTGSRRKVMVIAALTSGATVTLLDQPFGGLDQASIRVIKDFLREASGHTHRAWLVADYEAPNDVRLASLLCLDRSA